MSRVCPFSPNKSCSTVVQHYVVVINPEYDLCECVGVRFLPYSWVKKFALTSPIDPSIEADAGSLPRS